MKKFAAKTAMVFILIFSIAFGFTAFADFDTKELKKELKNNNYYMINLDTDTVVLESKSQDHVQPGAMNKVLAAVYAFEKWGNLDESVSIADDDLALTPDYYGIRKVGFSAGDSYTKLQLIQSMLIYSANDSEAVIAKRLSGSNEGFVKELNSFAKSIGCKNTKIVSAYGFDEDGQYTSSEDVALIMKYGLNNSAFFDAIQMSEMKLPSSSHTEEKSFQTATMMTYAASPYYHASVKGGKETSTEAAGKCTAVYSVQDANSYVTVVMNGKTEYDSYGGQINTANKDIKAMLNWVYKNLSIKTIAQAGAVLKTLPVAGGKKSDEVQLTVKDTVSALVLNNVNDNSVLVECEGTDNLKLVAPIREGDVICKAQIKYAGKTIATVDLVSASTITLSTGRLVLQKFSKFMTSGFVIFIEVVALFVLLALLAFYVMKIVGINKMPDITVIKKNRRDVENPKKEQAKTPVDKFVGGAKSAFNSAKTKAGGITKKMKRK